MEIGNIDAKHREASNVTGIIFSNIMEGECQPNESLSLGRWISRLTEGRSGRQCHGQTQVSFQLQQQPPGFTWAPDSLHRVCLKKRLPYTESRSKRSIKQYSWYNFLGGRKKESLLQIKRERGNITLPKPAKRNLQTLLWDLSAAQFFPVAVTASTGSGGLKRL